MTRWYRWAVVAFMLFFLFEYFSPIINALELGRRFGWSLEQLFSQRQVLKHVLRLPIYTIIYIWVWSALPKMSKTALWWWRIMAGSHLIFKPLTILTLLGLISTAGLLDRFPIINLLWTAAIVLVYAAMIIFVEKYWKELVANSDKI